MARLRGVRFLLLAAVGLIVLGIGNLMFGTYRIVRYQEALQNVVASTSAANVSSLRSPTIERIQARLAFYRMVAVGGRSMLAVAAVLMFGLLWFSKKDLTWELLAASELDAE